MPDVWKFNVVNDGGMNIAKLQNLSVNKIITCGIVKYLSGSSKWWVNIYLI